MFAPATVDAACVGAAYSARAWAVYATAAALATGCACRWPLPGQAQCARTGVSNVLSAVLAWTKGSTASVTIRRSSAIIRTSQRASRALRRQNLQLLCGCGANTLYIRHLSLSAGCFGRDSSMRSLLGSSRRLAGSHVSSSAQGCQDVIPATLPADFVATSFVHQGRNLRSARRS